ncbi:hypothetical protein [uncultured Pontibacter sp.]|uniref:hypothetical protein n=1 Tax=uncultured Pontibacter sp. TaxID=453356 RepID=UPI00262B78AF|nr:hypothetical protein [uncultured Pontibacter sp.]
MKTQLLPNYFKKVGIIIFVLASTPSFISGMVDGWTGQEYHFFEKQYVHMLDIVGMLGIALYAFAKDKVHDELLHSLKLESVKLIFMASLMIVFLVYMIFPNYRIHPSYLVNLQIIGVIVLYYYKKSNVINEVVPSHSHE